VVCGQCNHNIKHN
jgi:hypothetical protein